MLADGRLAGVELFGCLGETPVLVDSDKYFQVTCFYFSSPGKSSFMFAEKMVSKIPMITIVYFKLIRN